MKCNVISCPKEALLFVQGWTLGVYCCYEHMEAAQDYVGCCIISNIPAQEKSPSDS